jgi:hypothetical protein
MPLDFKKLLDPAHKAEVRARIKAAEDLQQQQDDKVTAAIDIFSGLDSFSRLAPNEQSFIRSCERSVRQMMPLSEPQEKWLFDLASRHAPPPAMNEDDQNDEDSESSSSHPR